MSTRSYWVPFRRVSLPQRVIRRSAHESHSRTAGKAKSWRPFGRRRERTVVILVLLLGVVVSLGAVEIKTSWLQSRILSGLAPHVTYRVEPSESIRIDFPEAGPYNHRHGYSQVGEFAYLLKRRGFAVDSQAVLSRTHERLVDLGIFPLYREKSQAGLQILDRAGEPLFRATYPARVYERFEEIPDVVVNTLLFIENRALLDTRFPTRNPAVEWDRFGLALATKLLNTVGIGAEGPGASTLATQLEKFRHSPDGRTGSALEKLRQMASASVRVYLDGPETMDARRQVVVDYLNSMPLSGRAGYGEVIGLAEGLEVWFGADFDTTNDLLRDGDASLQKGTAYRHVVSLLLANRRPSYLLGTSDGRAVLNGTADRYLPLLASAGIISEGLARAAQNVPGAVIDSTVRAQPISFVGRKAANAVRAELLKFLDMEHLYDLDHLDLSVSTTYHAEVQRAVTSALARLTEAEYVRGMGMEGSRLLSDANVKDVFYALTLFEAGPDVNRLVVQSDNFDGPFNVNEGSKLELGSTAKLRTLVTYLEVVEALYHEYGGRSASDLRRIKIHPSDHISRWARSYLSAAPGSTLAEMLDAAMARPYSASPHEPFFTGGGLHVFHNFSASDGGAVYTVHSGLRYSINLVFIRLMRDVVSYYTQRLPGNPAAMLDDPSDPRRTEYLERFADREGRQYLWKFYERYRGVDDVWTAYLGAHRTTPTRFAWAVRSVRETISYEDFTALLRRYGFEASERLYEKTDARPFDWHDRGYLAGVHPLELWLLNYRHDNAGDVWVDVVPASTIARQEAYRWLFKPNARGGHNSRIRTLIEEEAFAEIHKQWREVGYPFDRLVPSLATAIGSSADRPQALSELMGIILRGGLRYPTTRIESLHFADGTPYETLAGYRPGAPRRVLSEEVAAVLRSVLVDVVENGTAVRLRGGIAAAEGMLTVGGKTGTGDNRTKIYGTSGQVMGAEVQNRTSTFVFFIGDRWFGTVTAFVTGPDAARHRFTSSLPVQLLKSLSPELQPLFASDEQRTAVPSAVGLEVRGG